jgi:hypothetical protein
MPKKRPRDHIITTDDLRACQRRLMLAAGSLGAVVDTMRDRDVSAIPVRHAPELGLSLGRIEDYVAAASRGLGEAVAHEQ